MREYLLTAFESVIGDQRAAYVAGPLATGPRYYELVTRGDAAAAAEIRIANAKSMHVFAGRLRERLPYPVLNPGLLVVTEWSSTEMGDFFIDLIGRFARELWLMDGWQYSRGATKEFVFAMTRGIRCLDERGAALTPKEGIELIAAAVTRISSIGADAAHLTARADALRAMNDPTQ